jgi:hypothetical protein
MALLSQMFRAAAITGRTDTVNASWFAGRQGGRWAERTVSAAFPDLPGGPRREVAELQRRGVLTEAEAQAFRARLGL